MPPLLFNPSRRYLAMKCALLASGGKDCWLAAWYAISSGLDAKAILTFVPARPDSFMFHGINSKLVEKQAKSAQIRHIGITTSGEKEREQQELEEAFRKLKNLGFEAVITG
ncbi:hypothetical protein COY95_04635, partial [Candidatus Woesearchaeota archaeon CG_4_10_14_0_8_um_filter_47_5]